MPTDREIIDCIKALDNAPVKSRQIRLDEPVEVIEEWTPHKHTLSIDGDVQPKFTDDGNYVLDPGVQPIPNCPDGRYRGKE